jgi:phosphatidylglycerol:prolipoprotein diacylglycerol transferase
MHPILLKIGSIELPAYGALLVFAFLVSTWLLRRESRRMGLDPKRTGDVAIVALLFGLVGAKALLIFVDLPEYLANPKLLWGTIRSAGVIYGGLAFGALGVIWYIRKHKLPFWDTLDIMAPFTALGVGLGRLACLMAGCCCGTLHDGPLAIVFPDHPYCEAPAGIGLFPIQIVSLINGVVLCILLVWLLRHRTFPGQILAAYTFLYAVTRGLIEIYRGDEIRGLWLGGALSTSQLIAVAAAVGAVFLYLYRRKASRTEAKTS